MKKVILYLFGITLAITGCQKKLDNSINGQSADDRLAAAMAKYQSILTKAPYGWKVLEKSGIAYNGGTTDSVKATFIYYMQFNDSGSVKMYSDFDSVQSTVPRSSTYRLKALQRPTLLFDTYSYIHMPCDPNPTVSKSPLAAGLGWGTDFEFAFSDNVDPSQLGDTIHLVGLTNFATAYMVKATQAEQAIFANGQYFNNTRIFQSTVGQKILTYWKRFAVGTTTYEIGHLDFPNKQIIISWLDAAGSLHSLSTTFFYGFDGSVTFNEPLVDGTTVMTGFKSFSYNGSNVDLTVTGPNAASTVKPSIVPFKVDVTAAQKWYVQFGLNFNNCWVADYAFHNAGIDDYCSFKAITGFQNLWYAGPSVFGGPFEGLIVFTGGLNIPFTLSLRPFAVNTGIARFTLLGSTAGFTGTTATALAMTAARKIMYNGAVAGSFQDWYFVPTSTNGLHYDMVRFTDAQAWISWRPR